MSSVLTTNYSTVPCDDWPFACTFEVKVPVTDLKLQSLLMCHAA